MPPIEMREATISDHARIQGVMVGWWGGRDLGASIPKVMLIHFCNTSFVAEADGELVGFLIGFFSQIEPDTGYIHFAGVHPGYRDRGIGRTLYEKFCDRCKTVGRQTIKSCTAPINGSSINFHKSLGFDIVKGDTVIDGVEVSTTFMGPKDPLVLFVKNLN